MTFHLHRYLVEPVYVGEHPARVSRWAPDGWHNIWKPRSKHGYDQRSIRCECGQTRRQRAAGNPPQPAGPRFA